jgi:hypothetical protein
MVVCSSEGQFCAFTLFFGIFSIICFFLIVPPTQDAAIIIFNKHEYVLVLFLARFLCLTMIVEYFIPVHSTIIFFVKECVLLFTYCVTAYYFIFQAEFILAQNWYLRYLVFFSILVSIACFVTIIMFFIFELALSDPQNHTAVTCDAFLWILMRSLGMMMTILFIVMGKLISNKLYGLSEMLNRKELRTRLIYLW